MVTFRGSASRVFFMLVLGAVVLASSPLTAQITRGAISGVVRDPSSLVVPGATVTVTNDATKTSQVTSTDVEGFYRVAALEPGRYTVKVELQAFSTVEAKDIVVPPSTEVRVPVELKVGNVTETVSVSAAALGVSLNKTSPTLGMTLGAKQVVEFPLAGGRNINNLILSSPNVSMAGFTTNQGQGTYIVNGQRSRNNNYMIDGSDNNDISVTISTAAVVPESVAEFQVLTNPYSVEFGRNTGGQINVITKSGSDLFKGDLWDYYTTSKFYSLTNLEKASGLTEPARFYRHQAGGDIGGPIIKGRTFFYGLFQYDPQRPAAAPSTTTVRVPTPNGLAALSNVPLGAGQTAASRQAVLSRLSFLNDVYAGGATFRILQNTLVNGVPIETGQTNVNIISPSTYKTLQVRVDNKVTNNDNVTVRELSVPRVDDNVAGFNCAFGGAFCGNQNTEDNNFAASETHVFNSARLNEFRASWVRRNLDFPENDPNSPTATICGLFPIGGVSNFPQSRLSDSCQFSDTLTWEQVAPHVQVRRGHPLQHARQRRRLRLEGHVHVRQPAGLHEQPRRPVPAGAADGELDGHAVAALPVRAGRLPRPARPHAEPRPPLRGVGRSARVLRRDRCAESRRARPGAGEERHEQLCAARRRRVVSSLEQQRSWATASPSSGADAASATTCCSTTCWWWMPPTTHGLCRRRSTCRTCIRTSRRRVGPQSSILSPPAPTPSRTRRRRRRFYSVSVQRELGDFLVEVGYTGSRGFHGINQST